MRGRNIVGRSWKLEMAVQIDVTETFTKKKETTRSAFRWLWLIHLGSSRILGYTNKLSLSWYTFILFSICNSYMFSPRKVICEKENFSPWCETSFSLSLTSRVQLNDLCVIQITHFRLFILLVLHFLHLSLYTSAWCTCVLGAKQMKIYLSPSLKIPWKPVLHRP